MHNTAPAMLTTDAAGYPPSPMAKAPIAGASAWPMSALSGGAVLSVASATSTALVAVDPGVGLALTGSDGWKGAGALAVLAIAGGVLLAFVGRTRRMRGRRIA